MPGHQKFKNAKIYQTCSVSAALKSYIKDRLYIRRLEFRELFQIMCNEIQWRAQDFWTGGWEVQFMGVFAPPPHTLFGKEKKMKCIIIAWYYTNVHLTVFWAQIHQKCAPNYAKLVHKSQNFPTSQGGSPPAPSDTPCWCLYREKLLPPPLLKSFRGPCNL